MEAESEKRRLRLISGPPAEVEWQLNRLLDEYVVTTWNFAVADNKLVVTAVLLDLREIRKMAIANPMPPGPVRR